ncbi:sperm-associated antigen 5 [Alligator mississippiensis]|uniref:sperm-associated antigen 5 n=1 Tax=Alligator mississippiensis TaxID=8496 RepID=UPI002877DED9|nr:sperm-associated antigen 5 [Alligator mississippiensis]
MPATDENRERGRGRERGPCSPAPRAPLRDLPRGSSALTPLLRRLRLKDDCGTPRTPVAQKRGALVLAPSSVPAAAGAWWRTSTPDTSGSSAEGESPGWPRSPALGPTCPHPGSAARGDGAVRTEPPAPACSPPPAPRSSEGSAPGHVPGSPLGSSPQALPSASGSPQPPGGSDGNAGTPSAPGGDGAFPSQPCSPEPGEASPGPALGADGGGASPGCSLEEAPAAAPPSGQGPGSPVLWTTPLAWLERSVGTSALLESWRQSLSLPALQHDAGTSVTPVSATSAGTSMTPRALLERGTNTSGAGPRGAKDSAAETDSLLWHCFREQLSSLSRSELEGRLESTLIIVEVLSYQLQGWQQRQGSVPGVGPAEQRDAPTQTDLAHPGAEERFYHDLYLESRERVQTLQRQRESERALRQAVQQATGEMRSWALQSRAFLDFAATSLQHVQTDRRALGQEREQLRALVSRCWSSLDRVGSKLQRCLEERDEARRCQGEALQAKQAGEAVLEELRCHAGARICCSEQGLAAQRELCTLLEGARQQQASWALESESFLEFATASLFMLRDDRRALGQGQEQLRALLSRGRSSLEGVASKLQCCLEERDEARRREEEALQATTAVSSRLEEVTGQREAALAALQDSVAQVEQLTTANSRLGTELSATVRELAVVEVERDQLQEENASYAQETARLRQEKEALQQERDRLRQELWEMTECHEFIDQENRVSRAQLLETEHKLKSTLATLRERSMQHEELQDAHHGLKMEESALRQELKACQAQLQDLQLKRDEVLKASLEIARGTDQLLGLARALRAAPQEEADGTLSWSRACTPARQTPHRLHTSFVGSVLKAMAGKDPEGDGIGVGSAFAKVEPAAPQKPAEAEASLLECVQELRDAIADLVAASTLAQEAEQERAQALQAEIVDLKQQLETLGAELDARDASIAKLNKALRVKLQSEKELQDVVQQQEEKMLQLIDRSGEVTSLKTEVSQLQRALQRAETEAKVLWEEVRDQQLPADTSNVQEKVWLRQEVNKLRELLLEKGNEISLLSSKYLEQRRILEGRLHQVQKVLKSQEETEVKVKEALSSIPDVVATSSQELQNVLRYLGLKPADGSGCPAAVL